MNNSFCLRLPHNPELERVVLGLLVIFPEFITTVLEILQPRDFYSEKHKRVYSKLLEMLWGAKTIDLVLLSNELIHDDLVTPAFLGSLLDGVPKSSISNLDAYNRELKTLSLARNVLISCQKAIEESLNYEESFLALQSCLEKYFDFKNKKASSEGLIEKAVGCH